MECGDHFLFAACQRCNSRANTLRHCEGPEYGFCIPPVFFTEEMIDLIVSMTNLHGRHTVKNWTVINFTDLCAYMGLLILAGVYRSRGESTRLWDDRNGRTIFRDTMSLSRFHHISRALRFDDKLQRPARHREDKLAPIRSL